MTLATRILAEKRAIVYPLLLLLLINILVYALVVYPLVRRSAGASDRAIGAAASLKAAERDEAAARALVNGRTRAQQELATFYDKVLPPDFVGARSVTYSEPIKLAKKSNVRYEAGTYDDDPTLKKSRVGRVHARIALQGEYENLRRFIYDLETSAEFIIIDGVTIAQGEPNRPHNFTLELSTYYRARGNGR